MGEPGEPGRRENRGPLFSCFPPHQIRPAVSRKELEKALHGSGETPGQIPDLTRVEARIEIVGDFADPKRIAEILKQAAARN